MFTFTRSFFCSCLPSSSADMDHSVACHKCHTTLSVPKYAKTIRCVGCRGIILVPAPSMTSKLPCEDQEGSITERKGLRSFCRKISSNVCHRSSSSSFNMHSYVSIADLSPQGKRALLCGVSYKNKKFRLRGTTQDVMSMRDMLVEKFKFPFNSILILAEDGPYEPPTKENILRSFDWLMKDLQSGDSLVFFYSGHGLRQLEFNGDETDGFDEAICPVDFETKGLILDNDINRILVGPLKTGVVLHAIIDACHSGTVLDLPHIYDRNERRWKGNYPPSGVYKGTSGGQAICISACEDHQQAADTSAFSPERTMAGAMTHNFIRAIKEKPGISYSEILNFMGKAIDDANAQLQRKCVTGGMLRLFHRKMLQDPQLSSSVVFNENLPFKL